MKWTAMDDDDWLNWGTAVKCRWIDCYCGMGLAGKGECFAGGDYKNPDCPKYKSEDEYVAEQDEKIIKETGI